MAVTFLIGGTGNQFFQFATSSAKDKFSTLFLSSAVRKLLGWTQHEQLLRYPGPGPVQYILALLALSLDSVLLKTARVSLFTTFETRGVHATPKITEVARIGYFQSAPERRDVAELASQLAPTQHKGRIVVHVRGGDLLALERAGKTTYGILPDSYFRAGIETALKAADLQKTVQLLVLTDDVEYARTLDFSVPGAPEADIQTTSLQDTLSASIGADWFVSSNSTMSYWIVRLRGGAKCVTPKPFQQGQDYAFSDKTVRLDVSAA